MPAHKAGCEVEWGRFPTASSCHAETNEMTDAPVLKHYQPREKLTLQCPASEKGMVVALLQEHLVAYVNRALSETGQGYAQTEKEQRTEKWSNSISTPKATY